MSLSGLLLLEFRCVLGPTLQETAGPLPAGTRSCRFGRLDCMLYYCYDTTYSSSKVTCDGLEEIGKSSKSVGTRDTSKFSSLQKFL